MREYLPLIHAWQARGDQVAMATVVRTNGSTPRGVGAKMVVNSRGEFAGSVSGGCVEGAVLEEARRVIKTGEPKLVNYGIGLSCGGSIQVFIEKL